MRQFQSGRNMAQNRVGAWIGGGYNYAPGIVRNWSAGEAVDRTKIETDALVQSAQIGADAQKAAINTVSAAQSAATALGAQGIDTVAGGQSAAISGASTGGIFSAIGSGLGSVIGSFGDRGGSGGGSLFGTDSSIKGPTFNSSDSVGSFGSSYDPRTVGSFGNSYDPSSSELSRWDTSAGEWGTWPPRMAGDRFRYGGF